MPPTFFEMLISLSFNITIILVLLLPASFSASNAMPPVNAPVSGLLQLLDGFARSKSRALAMPSATDMDVLLCPVLKLSYGDSVTFGKPAIPVFLP